MSLHFDCRACGTQHPSRLRIAKPHLLRVVMGGFGEVMEPCPLTARWVKVRFDDLHWVPSGREDRRPSAAATETLSSLRLPPLPLPT